MRDAATEAYTVDNQTNQYSAIAGNNLTYDDAGNLTQDRDGYIYDYDYENRLITVSLGGVGNLVFATFDYDALFCPLGFILLTFLGGSAPAGIGNPEGHMAMYSRDLPAAAPQECLETA